MLTQKKQMFKPLQSLLTVVRKEYITPHFLRLYFTSNNLSELADATVGINNKILIPPVGVKTVYFPMFDVQKNELILPPPDVSPIVRTYTHRGIDVQKNELWIDFVIHGTDGPASAWAMQAEKGDQIGVMMKITNKQLYTKASNYLLVGDATAIPVLSAILEDLSPHEKGVCVIEVCSIEDQQILKTKAQIEFMWLYNEHPKYGSELSEFVKKLTLPQQDRSAYVAAEFETVKQIRNYLRTELKWKREEVYAFSYWKAGQAEDQSQQDRHNERDRDTKGSEQ